MRGSPHPAEKWKSLVKLPIFFVINVALLLLVGVSMVRETYKGWTVDSEIHALESQVIQLEGRKQELVGVMDTLSSPEQVDFEARARLGWKKEGETVYVIPGYKSDIGKFGVDSVSVVSPHISGDVSNPKRWLNYFLHRESSKAIISSL